MIRSSQDANFKFSDSYQHKTIGQETVRMPNHDGSEYRYKTYDFFDCDAQCKNKRVSECKCENQFKIILRDIKINEYDKKNYETMNFKIALPSKNTFGKSGIVNGTKYNWYENNSPKINFKGMGSDDSIQSFFNLVKKLSLKNQCYKLDLIRIFKYDFNNNITMV